MSTVKSAVTSVSTAVSSGTSSATIVSTGASTALSQITVIDTGTSSMLSQGTLVSTGISSEVSLGVKVSTGFSTVLSTVALQGSNLNLPDIIIDFSSTSITSLGQLKTAMADMTVRAAAVLGLT